MACLAILRRLSLARVHLIFILTVLWFSPQFTSALCPNFPQNGTAVIAPNTVCELTSEPTQLWRLEVQGEMIIKKRTPAIELDIRELIVYPSGRISADGMGFTAGTGTGAGTIDGSGGSYGGRGGHAAGVFLSQGEAVPYGPLSAPTDFGSPGGGDSPGNGGGVIIMKHAKSVEINGIVSADGNPASDGVSGGGSGGSILIQTIKINGSGIISASGGRSSSITGGGGSGGRIAIQASANSFLGNVRAYGGYTSDQLRTISNPAPYSPSRISTGQYQTVTFSHTSHLYAISIKGCASYNECRYNKNNRPQYVTKYYIQINSGTGTYNTYTETPGGPVVYFTGNSDGVSTVTNYFTVPVLVKSIRIVPHSYYKYKYMDLTLLGNNQDPQVACWGSDTEGIAEVGGPGTIYLESHEQAGELIIDNGGHQAAPKKTSDCSQFFMEESGASAWIPADTHIEFGRITITAASHLVVEGSVNVTNITRQLPAFMHVMSQGVLTIDDHLNVQTFVSTEGNLRLPGKSVTISQSLSVWGTMSVQPSTSITFNGDQLKMIPDVTIATNQILSLVGLSIGLNADVVLDESMESSQCGYALEIHGGDQGSIDMATGSSLSVGCPVTIIASSVTFQRVTLDQTGHGSDSFTEASLIRTPKLVISEVVSTGLIKLESVDEFIVGDSGELTFEPFFSNFTVAYVSSAGIVESKRPLSIFSDQFEILNGEFVWPGTINSAFDAFSASVNGVFRPGQAVSITGGFHDFVVGEQGDVEINVLTDFKADEFIMNGEMRINEDVVFTGWSGERMNNFTTGVGSDLILTETEGGPRVPCQLHADSVTIDGNFYAGLLDTGIGFISFQVGGHFVFDPIRDLEIGEMVISGWFESQSSVSLGKSNQTIFETTAESTVILNSNSTSGPHGLPYSQLGLISLNVGGVFTGSEIEFTSPMTSLMVTSTGDFTCTSVGYIQANIVTINGMATVSNNITIFGMYQPRLEEFMVGLVGQLTLDAPSQSEKTWSSTSYIYTHRLVCDGQFRAGLLSVDLPGQYLDLFDEDRDNFTIPDGLGEFDLFGELLVSGGLFFEPASDLDVFTVNISGQIESYSPVRIGIATPESPTTIWTAAGSTVQLNSLDRLLSPSGFPHSELFARSFTVGGIFIGKELDFPEALITTTVTETGSLTMTSVGPFECHDFNFDGVFKVSNNITLAGHERERSRYLEVGPSGLVTLDAEAQDTRMWTGVSNVYVHQLESEGKFYAGLLSVITENEAGADAIEFTGASAEFIFQSQDLELRTDYLAILSGARMEAFTEVVIRGSQAEESFSVVIGGDARAVLNSEVPRSSWPSSHASEIRSLSLEVGGTLEAGTLWMGNGWDNFTIGSAGQVYMYIKDDQMPIDHFSIEDGSAIFEVLNPFVLHGRTQSDITYLKFGVGSLVTFDSRGLVTLGETDLAFSRIDGVKSCIWNGRFVANHLSFNISDLSVGGHVTFISSTPQQANYITVTSSGEVDLTGTIDLHGLDTENVFVISIAGSVTFDVAVTSRGRDAWTNGNGSVIYADDIIVTGNFRAGLLSINKGLQYLTVNGFMSFEPSTFYDINTTFVGGHLKSFAPFDITKPIRGMFLQVSTNGLVDLEYQGRSFGDDGGAVASVVVMESIIVDGMLQMGSAEVITGSLTVGQGGIIQVTEGGHTSDFGPGAGLSGTYASGASFGARGGKSGKSPYLLAPHPYGSIYSPGSWGSGGGSTSGSNGGRGGGFFHAAVTDTFKVQGEVVSNGGPGASGHAGGGTGGAIWVTADEFVGSGYLRVIGGAGSSYGGGGSGGRITVKYRSGTFKSAHAVAHGGSSTYGEPGGPGVIYLEGIEPENKNIRIDNYCLPPQFDAIPSGDRATEDDYQEFLYTGAVAYLIPEEDLTSSYQFTLTEIHGGAVLVMDGNDTSIYTGDVVGDDTGAFHIGPFQTLALTKESTYKRVNITWAPYIYENARFILPPAVVEYRAPFDWRVFTDTNGFACPSSMLRSPATTIWGSLDGSRGHLLIGTGGTWIMGLPSNRNLEFVGITVQDSGHLIFKSHYGVVEDGWIVALSQGEEGVYMRDGVLNIEGGGQLSARCLHLMAESVSIESAGLLTLDGEGLLEGDGVRPAGTLSGAGHGGSGGKGRSTDLTAGYVYGSVTEPQDFGSGTRSGTITGGGILHMTVNQSVSVEGTVTSNGQAGGASGGSIWINTYEIEGSGIIRVNGGSGGSNQGGGSGGRLAVYYQEEDWWFGYLQAFGGSAPYGPGGAGTIYLENTLSDIQNRSLLISNNNVPPPSETIMSFDPSVVDGSRTWLRGEDVVAFDHVMLRDLGHLAVDANITEFHAFSFLGDQSVFLHVGPGQVHIITVAEYNELQANIYVYEGGILVLPPAFACYGVTIHVRGVIVAQDITIGQNCRLLLSPSGTSSVRNNSLDTSLNATESGLPGHYRFTTLTIGDGGEVTSTESLDNSRYFTLYAEGIYLQGGGILHNVDVTLKVTDLIVNDLGRLVADSHTITCSDPEGEGKSTSYGGSGAGHGGSGGKGGVAKSTGSAFGDVFEPVEFGCRGGGGYGGAGGGRMKLFISGTMQVDGEVSANGADGENNRASGGGSGGSIMIHVEHMRGYGTVEANGGDGSIYGSYQGGGGSAGRIAVYFSLNRTFSGSFQAFGGLRGGPVAADGGPGTVFFYHTRFNHRSLIINNIGRGPGEMENAIESYQDLSQDESRAWLLPISGEHEFAGNDDYYFEEVQIYGNAHLAALQEPLSESVSFYFENMIGDRTGTLHIGPNQEMDLYREDLDLPFSVRVYQDGHLGLANRTIAHGVTIYLDGSLSNVNNLTLHHGGRFWLNHHGHTSQSEVGQYEFDHVHVQDDGYIHMVSDPVEDISIGFEVITLHVDGGGLVEGTHVYVQAENITVDAGGNLRADGQGYRVNDGVSMYPNGTFRRGRHGVINFGLGFTGSEGSSGAGHGGSGGHGQGASRTGLPYSDLYEPEEFGSAGGGASGGAGGGRIWFNVTDTIHIDGVVSSDGAPGGAGSGGGSGGSIWMHCNLIKGYGTISANGGDAGSNSGGGAGGRIALNFWKNETANGFKFESHGGAPDGDWEGGGPGTVFMYHHKHEHRTLYIENGNLFPKEKTIDWNNIEEDGCRAWILPISGTHQHAGRSNEFHFEELQVYDGAHLAVIPPGEALTVVDASGFSSKAEFSFLLANSTEMEVAIFFKHMIGDRTGAIHVANKQEMDLERPEIDLPFSTYVYHDGHLGLAPKTVVHGVEIFNAGLLSHIVNITLHHGGYLWTQHGGRTAGQPSHHYAFQTVRIQDEASVNATTDPIDEPGITFITEAIYIEGGGILHGTKLTMISENITIDDGGTLTAEGLGYNGHHGSDTHGKDSLHGDVNLGKPHPVHGLGGGAGHGGSGGRGPNGKAGFAYGDLYEPFLFGSAGGHGLNDKHGGTGGGYVWLNISDTIHIDGELTANGGYADEVGSGGGSAGSVWLHCNTIKGYGRIAVDGGDGYEDSQHPGAGGGGGRLAMYFYRNDTANGFSYHARGGRAGGPMAENGGAGTVFLYHMVHDHRTLLIDNGGLEARTDHHTLYDYNDWADDGCRTWVLSLSGHHYFAGGDHSFHFEELQIYGSAHLAVLTEPIGKNVSLFFLYMIGDRTGTVHIAENQSLDLHRPEIDLPFSARVYANGYLGLAPDTYVHDVSIWLHGTLAHVRNMTLHHYGMFTMEHGGHTLGHDTSSYYFDNILVQDDATILGITSTTQDPGIFLYVLTLTIEGGGTFHGTRLFIQTENITVDDGGSLNVDGRGYNRTNPRDNLVGVNVGQGVSSLTGSSGGGFGGTSGRGKGTSLTGQPYGNLYEPFDFGSSGGGTLGGAGGGILLLNVTGFAINDGVISANGMKGDDATSGSGSGGTVLMTTNVLRGQGVIAANGGDQSQSHDGGAGSGGRIAVYFEVNETYRGEFHCRGGEAFNTAESGGPGTIFLYHLIHEHRTLMVDNRHLTSSHVGAIPTYSDLSQDSFKAWVLPQSGEHHFAGGNHNYHFEELQILGNAHLAYRTEPYDRGASLYFKHMIGDWTGSVHIGPNQVMDLERHFINVPFNIYIYERGYTGLGYETVLSQVFVHIEGELDHVKDLVLYNGGEVRAFLMGHASTNKPRHFSFNTIRIKADSRFNFSMPFAHLDQYVLSVTSDLYVEGGGLIYGKNLMIHSSGNMTVDDGGIVDVSDGGFLANQGTAPGIGHHLGGSGAAHGGLGGRGACSSSKTCRTLKNLPYGSIYHPRSFGSGGYGNQGGIGGGILEVEVASILRVDGTIKANSLNKNVSLAMSGASGGSGGSILVCAGAFVGGHTGRIEASGGSGDTSGGSGSGGRVAIHYANNVTHGEYLGSYHLQGGLVGLSGAEAGAAGTVYSIHTDTAHSMLYVNNYGRFPLSSEIMNIGQRLDLSTVRSFSKKSITYQADNGITVKSTGAIYNAHGGSDDLYYAIGYLFDQSLGSSHTHFYRNVYRTATLTFDLKKVYFLNTVRVHVICTLPTRFKITGKFEGSSIPVTTSYVNPPSPCSSSDPYLEVPVRQLVDGLVFDLTHQYSSGDAGLSEIELYVDGENVYDRYNHRELDSAKSWIEDDEGPHEFSELTVIGGAQLAFMPVANLTAPVEAKVGHFHGDSTGYVHIGYAQSVDITHTNPDVPFSSRIYENGHLGMPHRTFFWGVEMISSGKITGIEDLYVFDGGLVRFDSNSSLGDMTHQSEFHLNSLHVQDGGTFELKSHEKDVGMDIRLSNLTVYGGGFFKSNDRFNLTADHLFAIHSGGEINLDHGGYETMETRGPVNGYVPSEGPGQGYGEVGSSSGGSGGGHGGSGGRSSSQVKVGLPYGSIYEPVDYGSTGGYGRDYGKLYFGNQPEMNSYIRLGLGGRGGGAMKAVARHIFIDGKLSADGENGNIYAGGGSGGSLWLECEELDGDGQISANGGKGDTYAGGGAGGRVAVYHHRMHDFNGTISTYGGTGYGSYSGGAGTIYLERIKDEPDSQRLTEYKILKVDNNGISYPPMQNILDGIYDDITEVGGVTWLWHSSHEYQFNETHVYGNAYLALLSNTETEKVFIDGGSLYGDRSAVIHIGMNQSLTFSWVDIFFAANVMLYRHGWMAIPPRLSMRDVWFNVRGTFSHSLEMFVDSGGSLSMWSEGNSADHPVGAFKFTDITVRANGKVMWWSSEEFPEMTVVVRELKINAGGEVKTNRLILEAENITIDTSGEFHADGQGYSEGPGVGRSPLSAYADIEGASGGAHGGRGGRGYYGLYSSQGYGSVHEPRTMGSGGGPSSGSAGSGGGTILMTVGDTLRVEGELRVNGEAGTGYAGGGSGGSILGYLNHLDGAGSIQALGGRGGLGHSGGGSGGRLAFYYTTDSFIGDFAVHGATSTPPYRPGSGTIFLQDNFNVTHPFKKLLVDNNIRATKSRVTREETLSTTGVRVGSYQFNMYNGIVATTTTAHYSPRYTASHYYFSNLFQQNEYQYVSVSTGPDITLSFPFTTYLEAIKIYPICSGLGSGTSFKLSTKLGATVTAHTAEFVATSGCNDEYDNQKFFIRRDVEEVTINLYLGTSYAGLRFIEIVITEDPSDTDQQLEYSVEAESLLVGEEEEEFRYSEVEIRGGATLGLTGDSVLTTEAVRGDHTGQLNILAGQQFDILADHTLMPFSIFSQRDSSITLPRSLDCKDVEMALFGELHSLDHLKLSSHCIMGLQHSGDLAINITHLDVKTFGRLLINDWTPGLTSVTGTTLNVRSGGIIRASNLQLHFANISLEPSASLSIQYDPEAQQQIGNDLGFGKEGSQGSSGGGHGGNGGQGSSQNAVGTSYGNFMMPSDPGSSGGHSVFPHLGGEGAGKLFIKTSDTLTIDGTIEANGGNSRSPHSGGGSGGSIWIETEDFDGDGTLSVGGGSGDNGGGGGAGGFAAIYYTYNHYSGDFVTAGGESLFEPGGSGLIYLHQLQPTNGTQLLDATSPEARIHYQSNVTSPLTNRTLYLNNLGRLPRVSLRNLTDYYGNVMDIGAVTWLEPSVVAPIVRERNIPSHYYDDHIIIDELHLYGGAEVGFVRPLQPRDVLNIRLGTIRGDYTARMMVGFNQTLNVSEAHFPLNVDIYRGGMSSLYGELDIKGITFNIEGVLTNFWNVTITQGTLNMHEMIDTHGISTREFLFNSVKVRNHGTFYTHHGSQERFMKGNYLRVFGGGKLTSKYLHIDAEEVIVDTKGSISVNGQGYQANDGPGAGMVSGAYGTGASHGGEGGARSASKEVPPAYGSFTAPMEYGSGGGNSGGSGGGILKMETRRLEVEGSIDGGGASGSGGSSGGGSGGSMVIQTDLLYGGGIISVDGGSGGSGGGGGRLAVYYQTYLFHGTLDAQGGSGLDYEHGAAGTVYMKQTGEVEHKTMKIYNNFRRANTQTRRTLITLPPVDDLDQRLDLLDIGHFAHVELEAVDMEHYSVMNLTERVLHVKRITGDNTGTMHVGEKDVLDIEPQHSKYLPFSLTVYEDGEAILPEHTITQDVAMTLLGGRVAGVQDLEIHKGANLILHPDGKINSYNISQGA